VAAFPALLSAAMFALDRGKLVVVPCFVLRGAALITLATCETEMPDGAGAPATGTAVA
jgi:hypothetical protein